MSSYENVTVYSSSDHRVATGATANIVDDAEQAQVWGGTWQSAPTVGQAYRLTSGGLLDWTGKLTGGEGTKSSPYAFVVTDSERERRAARVRSAS